MRLKTFAAGLSQVTSSALVGIENWMVELMKSFRLWIAVDGFWSADGKASEVLIWVAARYLEVYISDLIFCGAVNTIWLVSILLSEGF